jgi:Phosphoglucomutase
VATVAPLADDPAVQQAIATRLTDEVFAALNVQEVISDTLAAIGERATLLAGPLTNALHGFVQEQVLKVVESDAFETFWVEANRFVHTQVLAIMRGESDTVSLAEGKVLLNLVPLVNLASPRSRTFVRSRRPRRDPPDVEPGEVPSSQIAKLEQALGIDLPDNYGQIPVYDSQDLKALQQTLYTAKRLLILLLVLIPVLIAAALSVSTRRRRTLVQLTVGGAIGSSSFGVSR